MNKYHLLISDEANLDAAFTLLIQHPYTFQTKYKQIRICYLARFPFGIHYLIDNDVVKVVAVFHCSRDPKKWRDS